MAIPNLDYESLAGKVASDIRKAEAPVHNVSTVNIGTMVVTDDATVKLRELPEVSPGTHISRENDKVQEKALKKMDKVDPAEAGATEDVVIEELRNQ